MPQKSHHRYGKHVAAQFASSRNFMEKVMGDLLWIAIMAGLLAATLAYVRLCDNA